MSIPFSDGGMARGSDLSCYGSQRFPTITVRFGGGSRSNPKGHVDITPAQQFDDFPF